LGCKTSVFVFPYQDKASTCDRIVKKEENWLTNISSAFSCDKCSIFGRVTSFQNNEQVKIIRLTDISGYCDIMINRNIPIVEVGHYLFLNDLKYARSKDLKFSDETKLINVTYYVN
jgi:hypothetical protein